MTRNNPTPKKGAGKPTVPGTSLTQSWKLEIHVKPGQSRTFLKKEGSVVVLGVREPARDGLANRGVLKALSDFLDTPVSTISILRGEGSRVKLVGFMNLGDEEGTMRLDRVAASVKGEGFGPDPVPVVDAHFESDFVDRRASKPKRP